MKNKLILLFAFCFLLMIPSVNADTYSYLWSGDYTVNLNSNSVPTSVMLNRFHGTYFANPSFSTQLQYIQFYNSRQPLKAGASNFLISGVILDPERGSDIEYLNCSMEATSVDDVKFCTMYDSISSYEFSLQLMVSYNDMTMASYCEIDVDKTGFFVANCPVFENATKIDWMRVYFRENFLRRDFKMFFGLSKEISFVISDSNNVSSAIKDQTSQQHQDSQAQLEEQKKQTDAITSESDDVESSSCGLICKIGGVFKAIGELPGKLINLLIDALKSLFVPTDSQLYEIINDSKELSENFGFVGESINFFINIFTSLLGMVNGNGCVELPEFSVGATSLFEKVTFWEAQNVCLADNVILSTHIDTIRTVTSIVLVCLFISFASTKFFNILSKNDSNQASMDAYSLRGGK